MKMKRPAKWRSLDNAAKIFSSTSTKNDTNVFRFSCELTEPVDAAVLQNALDQTMGLFSVYRSVMHRGLFWYYLEESSQRPLVCEDHLPPCSPIYDKNKKSLLFRVTYYKSRVNLEVHHVLSDGTGALQFLKTLLCYYLSEKHGIPVPSLDFDASDDQRQADSFLKYYNNQADKKPIFSQLAYKIRGFPVAENRMKIIEGVVPVKQVLSRAHQYNATLTAFLVAVFFCAIAEEMPVRAKRKPVVISVPVDLRQFFSSGSIRNFFGVVNIRYQFSKEDVSFEQVLNSVQAQFKEQFQKENLANRLNALGAVEHNFFARIAPLFLKDICLKAAYDFSALTETAAVSNVGKIAMPDVLAPYIRLFDICVSTRKVQICMCSYGENLAVSFSSPFQSTDIQKHFFRALTAMGIPVRIITNQVDD